MPGLFITFEGTEGSANHAKSTAGPKIAFRRLPGATLAGTGRTPIGPRIRHRSRQQAESRHDGGSELLLMNASRAHWCGSHSPGTGPGRNRLVRPLYIDNRLSGLRRQLPLPLGEAIIDSRWETPSGSDAIVGRFPETSEIRRLHVKPQCVRRDRFEESDHAFFERVAALPGNCRRRTRRLLTLRASARAEVQADIRRPLEPP